MYLLLRRKIIRFCEGDLKYLVSYASSSLVVNNFILCIRTTAVFKHPWRERALIFLDLLSQVVFRAGEGALQVLPPLVDALPEAKLNLVSSC